MQRKLVVTTNGFNPEDNTKTQDILDNKSCCSILENKLCLILSTLREKFPSIYVSIIMSKHEYVIQTSPLTANNYFEITISNFNSKFKTETSCCINTPEMMQTLMTLIKILE